MSCLPIYKIPYRESHNPASSAHSVGTNYCLEQELDGLLAARSIPVARKRNWMQNTRKSRRHCTRNTTTMSTLFNSKMQNLRRHWSSLVCVSDKGASATNIDRMKDLVWRTVSIHMIYFELIYRVAIACRLHLFFKIDHFPKSKVIDTYWLRITNNYTSMTQERAITPNLLVRRPPSKAVFLVEANHLVNKA